MPEVKIQIGCRFFLPRPALDELISTLLKEGYTVLGPAIIEGAVSLQPIQSAADLPKGIKDDQDGGKYRLVEGDPELNFEYVVGPQGPKRHFFPSNLQLFQFHVAKNRFDLDAGPPQVPKLAFLGVRPCELAAIKVQDRVFGMGDPGVFRCESEPWYMQSRQESLMIAVNCNRPGGTCFCASWGTGPKAADGFDLALTELHEGFVVDVGSKRGSALAEKLPIREPSGAELELADLKLERAREHMGRRLDTDGLKELLDQSIGFPEWDDVAKRCLSCGNCTMVCPTCFCCTVTDATDLSGEKITRTRQWESCYTHQFTYTPAGPERNTIRGRYRHWMRHKLCTWWDQFNMSGCVGCGRCITWCPVGIDLTEESKRLREVAPKHLRGSSIREREV
ncbi:MAG: 4Fe-4S dicluster domain-containing protein [Thermoguttaceae bacterium]|jgi:ferredoxin